MPMARHLLPVAAYTGAATMTPCRHSPPFPAEPLKLLYLAGCTALPPLLLMGWDMQCRAEKQELQGMEVTGYSQGSCDAVPSSRVFAHLGDIVDGYS